MKLVVVILAFSMIIMPVLADKVIVNGYNCEFEMAQPHIVEHNYIGTYHGGVFIFAMNKTISDSAYQKYAIGYTTSRDGNVYNLFWFGDEYGMMGWPLPNTTILMFSQMNLTDTNEFMKSLKVTKA